jgi:DNA-binding transcriptional LysR family regulator
MSTSRTLNVARWMITFAKIIDCSGISSAARALDLDKAVVSRQLRDLERHMGVRLLNRSTQHSSLTDVGRAVYERSSRIVHELEGAKSDAENSLAAPSGALTVTASVAFGRMHVVPLLREFTRLHPQISIELCLLDRQVDLVEEGFDILLRLCDAPPLNLAAQRLCDVSYVLVASTEALTNGVPVNHPQDLTHHNCLFYGFRSRQNVWRMSRGLDKFEIAVSSSVSVNSSEAVRDLARAGLGVALLPRFAVASDLRSGALHAVLPDYDVVGSLGNSLFMLHMSGRYTAPKTRAFMEFLKTRWSPIPPWETLDDTKRLLPVAPVKHETGGCPFSNPQALS